MPLSLLRCARGRGLPYLIVALSSFVPTARSQTGGADGRPAAAPQPSCPCFDGTYEGEPGCGAQAPGGDRTNGGCEGATPAFSPIELGEVVCGTSYGTAEAGDTDAFLFSLATPTTITASARASFLGVLSVDDLTFGCPGTTLTTLALVPCADGRVTLDLPAGTYALRVAPGPFGAPAPCGAPYTLALARTCTYYPSEALFDGAFPDLPLEDFEDANLPPGAASACSDPADASSSDACFQPGDIEPGLAIASGDGQGLSLLGHGWICGGNGNGTETTRITAKRISTSTDLRFDPPARQVGLTLQACIGVAQFVDVQLFRPGEDEPFATTKRGLGGHATFFGVSSLEPIGRIVFADRDGEDAELLDRIRFGDRGAARHRTYADPAAFDTLHPDLASEDFEGADVGPGAARPCDDPSGGSAGGESCFGSLNPGLKVGSATGSGGLLLLGPGFGGVVASKSITANAFADGTRLVFQPPVRQLAFELACFVHPDDVFELRFLGSQGERLFTEELAVTRVPRFLGIASDAPVRAVEIADRGGDDMQIVDAIRFGSSKRNLGIRFCAQSTPNSTGQPGLLIVTGSSVDAADDLVLTALHLPAASNIGYFLMGSGASPVEPPGAGSALCVAPGLRRFLTPVENTSELGGGFTRAVGTQGPGDSAAAAITPGSTWNFQAWYRDQAAGTSHFTDAVSVTFR